MISSSSFCVITRDWQSFGRARVEPDGTGAETTFCLSPKRTSPFKSAGESVQSTAGSRGVRISVSNAGYTTFRGHVKSTGYPLHSPVSPSLLLPCVTVCHHIPNAVYSQAMHSTPNFVTQVSCTGKTRKIGTFYEQGERSLGDSIFSCSTDV